MVKWGLSGCCVDPSLRHEIQVVTLENVDVKVAIRGFVAKIVATLTYENDSNNTLEVEYRMPVDEGAAIYKFEAVVAGRKITAQCMEKKEATKVYEEAVQSGHTAVLGREDNLMSDIFHLALGNLPAKSKAELHLSMVMELKVKTDGAVSFTLPAALNPRYCPADITPDMHTRPVFQRGGDRSVVVLKPYAFNINATVQGGHTIARITSHSDPVNVTLSDDAMSADVTQDGGFKPEHDWSILLYYANAYKTHIIRETGDPSSTRLMKDDVIMVNLHPEVSEQSYSNKNEVIFVVDRSGSMQGDNIQSARATLLLFLKSLPAGCYFNVISFGCSHSLLFPEGSKEYNESTLKEACALQEGMNADMGGTEILQPMKNIYSKNVKPGYARQIILLTDGQVFNVDQVKQLVSRYAHETRVFAVGIGHGASTALINGLAQAGRGRSEMVYQQDKLQVKVMGLVKSMLQDSVQNVEINFAADPPGGIKLVPKVPPVIFGGQHLILYARVPHSVRVKDITIKGIIGNKALSISGQESDVVIVHDEEMTLHRLAARAQINQWQIDDEEDVAEEMISLSLGSGVVSRLTALVGVDQDMKPVGAVSNPQDVSCDFEQQALSCTSRRRSSRQMRSSPMMSAYQPMSSMSASQPMSSMSASQPMLFMSASQPMCKRSTAAIPPPPPSGISSHEQVQVCDMQGVMIGGMQGGMIYDDVESFEEEEDSPKVEEGGTLMSVVNLQKFDGSWAPEDTASITSVSYQSLTEACGTQNKVALATAMVLAFLEITYSAEKDQWLLLANKARMFISSCGEDVEALIASAKAILVVK